MTHETLANGVGKGRRPTWEKEKKKQNLVNDVKNTLELGFKKNRPNYKMHSITIL